jgi:hypothetical protein
MGGLNGNVALIGSLAIFAVLVETAPKIAGFLALALGLYFLFGRFGG